MGDILPDEREKPLKYKICVLGGGGVGKSCLTFRLINDQFLSKYDPTIEDSYMKEGFNVDGEAYTVEIMDTAGQVSYLFLGTIPILHQHIFGLFLTHPPAYLP